MGGRRRLRLWNRLDESLLDTGFRQVLERFEALKSSCEVLIQGIKSVRDGYNDVLNGLARRTRLWNLKRNINGRGGLWLLLLLSLG